MSSYPEIIAGLHERFATVEGIVAFGVGEPRAVQDTPYLYTLFDRVEITDEPGRAVGFRYFSLHRLLLATQDTEQAEAALLPFVDALPASVEADPRLAGRIFSGMARLSSAEAVWVRIAGVVFRALDYTSEVLDKRPRNA